jgi:anthranilate synthase component 1
MKLSLTPTTLRPKHCDPLYLLKELGTSHEYIALLESVDHAHGKNEYSFLALGARDVLTVRDGKAEGSSLLKTGEVKDPLVPFEEFINSHQGERLLMGYVGFLSFEASGQFENIELKRDPKIPDAEFFLPEVVLRIDHASKEVTLITHEDSKDDLDLIRSIVEDSPFYDDTGTEKKAIHTLPSLEDIAPYRQTSREEYCKGVEKIQEGILDGEAFQVTHSQELLLPLLSTTPIDIYKELRTINPSPYMYYFQTPERHIVGASPETLLRVTDKKLLYRPIAGTRKRTGDEEFDAKMRAELLSDEKERCEHQMLVDLGRNDVGRVAEIGSVAVQNPFHCEQYAHVYHIVSDVTATLRDDLSSLDALRAVFPAGTLTGAPKLRAMEMIREQEKTPRGIYGGAFGYIDHSGNLDFAITIRTMHIDDRGISLRVGAGIVKDSVPELEDNECLHKARSCLAAVTQAQS